MLENKDTVLMIVDVQGKLAQLMDNKKALFANLRILIQAAKILDIPILWSQQVPASLGPTISELTELLTDETPIDKATFSCCGHPDFNARLNTLDRKQVLLAGIETHICIYQTAVQLLHKGYQVHLIADAVSCRTDENKRIGLDRIVAEGASLSSTEMALFELVKTAEHPRFKEIAKLIK